MDPVIETLKSTTFAGKRFTRKQLVEIQQTVKSLPSLSRRELGFTICEHLNMLTATGTHKIQSCLSALEEMEKQGLFTLPTLNKKMSSGPQKKINWTKQTDEPSPIHCNLSDLLPITLEVVTEKSEAKLWREYVDRYHYLGYKRPMGPYLRYYIIDRHGRKLGCLLFSFATLSLECRDQFIGWTDAMRKKHLQLILNNNRFLIFPWVNVKNLASKALSMATKCLPDDFKKLYNYRPVLLETFVDPTKYSGTCYQAANWQLIGKTAGRKAFPSAAAKPAKEVYIFPLDNNYKSILKNEKKVVKMRKNKKASAIIDDPFVQLWQNVIGAAMKVAGDYDRQWRKRNRLLDTLLVILFIFRLVFSKNKQGYKITIIELWDQCRRMDMPLPQHKPVAASAFCNARKKLDEKIFKDLNNLMISMYLNKQQDYLWKGHQIYAVDGSKINLPRQLLKHGYDTPSKLSHYPQGLLSCLYQLKSKIPTDFDLVSHGNERTIALQHLQTLNKNDVVVYDRGYFSYAMLHTHVEQGIHGVFRLQKNNHGIIDEFMASNETDQTILLDPSADCKKNLRKQYPNMKIIPLKLRLVKYVVSDTTYYLGTTLIDSNYTIHELSDVYHSRWGIEELYKISKVLIDVEDFHGLTERGIKQELFAHFVLITISRIFASKAEDDFDEKPDSSAPNKFKVNFKNTLVTIARNIEGLFIQHVTFIKKTIGDIVDSLTACRQKQRANRSHERKSMKTIKKWYPAKKKNNQKQVIAI